MGVKIFIGDCREVLRRLPAESVHCVVTSPPYFGLRDYGVAGQIGLEPELDAFVDELVAVFSDVRRVLRDDGTLWLNLGDSYANDGKWGGHVGGKHVKALHCSPIGRNKRYTGLKPKDMIGIPWRVAFALQADGWWLRSALPWLKVNPMPESCMDRPGSAVEYFFLLAKSERYHWDHTAVRRTMKQVSIDRLTQPNVFNQPGGPKDPGVGNRSHKKAINNQAERLIKHGKWKTRYEGWERYDKMLGRNLRNTDLFFDSLERTYGLICDAAGEPLALDVPTHPFAEAHFATFGPALIEPLIRGSCPLGGTVLDCFVGSGTTGLVADRLGRNCIGIELNPEYAAMAKRRIRNDAPLLTQDVELCVTTG